MKSSIQISLWGIFLIFLSVHSFGQNQEKEFDTLLTSQFPAEGPGATVLVAKEGKIIYRKAFGKANLELEVEMKPGHVFRIGSITKQFTACAILKLAEEGKLSLQDPINKFIRNYPTQGHTITIEHLLTHTSGIKDYTGMSQFTPEVRKKDFTPQELVNFFKNEPMDFAPGEAFRYSNSGYILLGYIIELISGNTYEAYIDENFFQPLGMKNSFYDHSSRIINNRVAGYQMNSEGYKNADFLSMTLPYAAGSLLSNVEDLYTWYEAVMNNKVVSKKSLEKAHAPYKLNNGKLTAYGYGWELGNIQGSPTIRHVGRINGFLTYSLYLPEEKVFVTILSNCNDNNNLEMTASKIAAITMGKPYEWNKIVLPARKLKSYEAVYESEAGGQRIVTYEEGRLLYFARGGSKSQLFPFEKDKFFFENSLTTLEFSRNAKGKITSFISRSTETPATWIRTDKETHKMEAVKVASETLEKYVGKYQFTPDFILSITKEGDKLYGKATGAGQIRQEIAPYDIHQFFARNLDAQLVFNVDAKGTVTGLTLIQNGEKKAKKMEREQDIK